MPRRPTRGHIIENQIVGEEDLEGAAKTRFHKRSTAPKSRRGNQSATGTPQPRQIKPAQLSTVEVINERENKQADEANVEELERTTRDFWGRSAQETDGAVPIEPANTDPLAHQGLNKPRRQPKHNM